jgi:iron-sulfur cluster assembly protein
MSATHEHASHEAHTHEEEFKLTDAAITHIKNAIKKRGKGIGIRIGIKTTGCSGKAYTLEYVDVAEATDEVFNFAEGMAVYIDPKSFEYLKNTTLDYVKRGLNEGFEFLNPNEKGRCGCGESFNV